MPTGIRKLAILAAVIGATAFVTVLTVPDAEAVWPLAYAWNCVGTSATQVQCDFQVTNPGPSGYRYKWQFGDGSQTGLLASTTVTHYYAVSAGNTGSYTVYLIGYASASSPSPDNIIGCNVSFGNDYGVGGGPTYSGNC